MRLVLCLGNIGDRYKNTYHNLGFEVGDAVATRLDCAFDKRCRNAFYFVKGDCVVAKPTTYMNLSGKAALELMQMFKIKPEDILAVFDDFDLPSGTMRKKLCGSGGTHNGARDLVRSVGTQIQKLKIGIKPPLLMIDIMHFVTSKIPKEERVKIDEALGAAVEEVLNFVAGK